MKDLAKIKRNVARMVAQKAPETDIDQYIAQEGVTLDEVRATPLAWPSAEQAKEEQGFGQKALNFARDATVNAMDMASLGWNDEIAAGIAALPALMPGGESYGEAFDRHHKRQNVMIDQAKDNPAARIVGDTIGLAPATLATGGYAAGAQAARMAPQALKSAPKAAQSALAHLAPAPTTMGRVGQAAGLGGVSGFVGGMGNADGGIANRVWEGVQEGAKGLAAGAVVGGAAEAIPALVSGARQYFSGQPGLSAKNRASNRIVERAALDDITPTQMVEQVRAARGVGADEYTLLDAGKSNVHGLARSNANTPGRGGDVLRDFTGSRKEGQYSRNIRAIEENLGPIHNPEVVKRLEQDKVRMVTDPLYTAGHKDIVPMDDGLRGLLARPSLRKQGGQYATDIYQETDRLPPKIYNKDGSVRDDIEAIPVEYLHYLRENLDTQIELLELSVKPQRQHGSLVQTRAVLDDYIKRSSGFMEQADAKHAEYMQDISALGKGYQYTTSKPRDVMQFQDVARKPELDMYRIGARARMGDELGKLRDGRDISKAFMSTKNQRHALDVIAPNAQTAQRHRHYLQAEKDMSKSHGEIVGNSSTARQLAMQQQDGLPAAEVLGAGIRQGFLPNLRNGLAQIVERTGRMTDAERQAIAEILTNTSEEGLQEFLDYALQNAIEQLAKQQSIGPVTSLGGLAAGIYAAQE